MSILRSPGETRFPSSHCHVSTRPPAFPVDKLADKTETKKAVISLVRAITINAAALNKRRSSPLTAIRKKRVLISGCVSVARARPRPVRKLAAASDSRLQGGYVSIMVNDSRSGRRTRKELRLPPVALCLGFIQPTVELSITRKTGNPQGTAPRRASIKFACRTLESPVLWKYLHYKVSLFLSLLNFQLRYRIKAPRGFLEPTSPRVLVSTVRCILQYLKSLLGNSSDPA